MFLTFLDYSIVTIALPSIGKSIQASAAELQWVLSGFALGFGLVPIIGGRLGDDRGRRLMLLIGIAGFVVTSGVVGLAPNPEVLLVGRVVQGMFGGLINPQVAGLIQQMFTGNDRARAFGYVGFSVGFAGAAGPVVGGVLIYLGGTDLGWRIAFLINVPVGVTAFVLCLLWLPRTAERGPPRALDLPGAALLALGLLGLLFPAVEYDSDRDLRLGYLFIPAAVLLAAFFAWERGPGRRRGYPLIDTRLFRIRSFSDGLTLALLYFAGTAGLPLALSLFLQDGLGYPALASAAVASAMAVGVAGSALVAGRLLPRYGGRMLVVALMVLLGGLLILIAVLSVAVGRVPAVAVGALIAVPLLVCGVGIGAVTTPNQVLTLAEIDTDHGSTAGGMLQTSQRIGLAIGGAVAAAAFYSVALPSGSATPSPGSPVGRAQEIRYGHAYLASLTLIAVLVVAALLLATRSVRRMQALSAK